MSAIDTKLSSLPDREPAVAPQTSAPTSPFGFRKRQFGKNHAYYLGNEKLTSVTTVIREGVPSPALIGWAARTVAEYAADHLEQLQQLERNAIVGLLKEAPNDVRDTAGARGRDVHELAHRVHTGEEVEVPPHLEGLVEAHLRWIDDWQPRDELLERPVVSVRWKYAGTFDLIATLRDGKRHLIEFKTNRSGPYFEVALQLAGYRFAEWMETELAQMVRMPAVDATDVLWLTSDAYQFMPVIVNEQTHKSFLYAMEVAKFVKRCKATSPIGDHIDPVLL